MDRRLSLKYLAIPRPIMAALKIATDAASVFAAYLISLMLYYGPVIPNDIFAVFWRSVLPIVLIYIFFYNTFSLYRRFAEPSRAEKLLKMEAATTCAAFFVFMLMDAFIPEQLFPVSVYIGGGIITMALVGFTRMNYYALQHVNLRFRLREAERAMIIGAGETGCIVIRQLLETRNSGVMPVVIVDDDAAKKNTRLQGIKVAGDRHDIPKLVEKYRIEVIIFCMPSVSPAQKKEILQICIRTRCKVRTVPGLDEILNGNHAIPFRKFEMSDLLPRPEIKIDIPGIQDYIAGSIVLVTGGGGSIGAELCRQMAVFEPKKLVILDIYENSAYELQMEMRQSFPDLEMYVEIGSIRDPKRLDEVFSRYRPDVVFHAAAHKHVPLMEANPAEAVKNNVFGTMNTAQAADKYGVSRFVLISTDKAVHPSSVMGATKRLAEYVIQYMNSFSKTLFVAVRFGNVLGSHGSVIPLFQKQIERGGPVTVTHKDITRYFMTIPEAARLVLQAGSLAHKGEVFILDMGEPVKIDDVARMLIKLSGYEPDIDIKIEYTGLRPGEKLFEELFLEEEKTEKTEYGGIMVGLAQHPDPTNTKKILDWLRDQVDKGEDVRECLRTILETYLSVPAAEQIQVVQEIYGKAAGGELQVEIKNEEEAYVDAIIY